MPFRIRRCAAAGLACAVFVFALAAAGAERSEERFFAGIPDLPVMPGLSAVEEEGVVFVKPEGRIVTVVAEGNVARRAVLDYYAATLPQLGWTETGPGRFRREGESLRLEFAGRPAGLAVTFSLSPL